MGKELGNLGEKLAEEFLRREGHRVIAKNWRCKDGEIDIVTMDGATVVFVEVKTASGNKFGNPLEWVTPYKAKKLIALAREFIYQNSIDDTPVRFDIIAIDIRSNRITHIKNAFWVDEDGCA